MTGQEETRRKRFYANVSVETAQSLPNGFGVRLDGRPLRTPGKRELAVEAPAVAEAIAQEWRAQGEHVDPLSMPMTRLVNSAIDGVTGREAEVRADIVAYAGSDLVCYLAEGPTALVERQTRGWGAVHAWAKRAHGIELELAVGVMPVEQPAEMLERVAQAIGEVSPLVLAALHVVTTLTGSALIALALRHRQIGAAEAWRLAHIDEDFQIENWGEDAEARTRRQARWQEMASAAWVLETLA